MDSRAGNSKTVVFKSSPQSSTTETEIQIPNFPIVKQEDNSQLLPSYFASKSFLHRVNNRNKPNLQYSNQQYR